MRTNEISVLEIQAEQVKGSFVQGSSVIIPKKIGGKTIISGQNYKIRFGEQVYNVLASKQQGREGIYIQIGKKVN